MYKGLLEGLMTSLISPQSRLLRKWCFLHEMKCEIIQRYNCNRFRVYFSIKARESRGLQRFLQTYYSFSIWELKLCKKIRKHTFPLFSYVLFQFMQRETWVETSEIWTNYKRKWETSWHVWSILLVTQASAIPKRQKTATDKASDTLKGTVTCLRLLRKSINNQINEQFFPITSLLALLLRLCLLQKFNLTEELAPPDVYRTRVVAVVHIVGRVSKKWFKFCLTIRSDCCH